MSNHKYLISPPGFDSDRYANSLRTAERKAKKLSQMYGGVFIVYEKKKMLHSSKIKVSPKT